MESKCIEISLGSVAKIVMGQSPPGKTYNEIGEGFPFYQGVADFGERYPRKRVYCTSPARLAESGDILFSVRAPIGRVNLATGNCAIGRGLAMIRSHNPLDQTFLEFSLRAKSGEWHALESQGSVFGNARKSDLEELSIIWPDGKIRRAIAHILGTLDDKIELNRRMNETLEAIAGAIFKSWFVDFDPVRAKAKGQPTGLPKEIEALFPDSFEESELGEIPRGWKVKCISDLGQIICGKTPPTREKEYYGVEVPFITIPDMHGKVFVTETKTMLSKKGANSQFKKWLPKNSVNVSCIATPGLVTLTGQPSQTNQQINSIVCAESVSQYWCYFQLKAMSHDIITGGLGGSATLNFNKTEFSKLQLVVPNRKLMEIFHYKVSAIFEYILINEHQSSNLAAIRDALLPKLLSGEIGVQDAEKFLKERGL